MQIIGKLLNLDLKCYSPIYFVCVCVGGGSQARKDILKIHTRQWTPSPSDAFLEELADKCVGMFANNEGMRMRQQQTLCLINKISLQPIHEFLQGIGCQFFQWTLKLISFCSVGYCGADIKAVCSEAALCALRRRYPQIYSSSQKLVLDVNSIAITNKDFMSAMSKMVPAAQRYDQDTFRVHSYFHFCIIIHKNIITTRGSF